MKEFTVAPQKHYQGFIGALRLSCAWLGDVWELAVSLDGKLWEPFARSHGIYDGGGMFTAAKEYLESGKDVEEIYEVIWNGYFWSVLTFDMEEEVCMEQPDY